MKNTIRSLVPLRLAPALAVAPALLCGVAATAPAQTAGQTTVTMSDANDVMNGQTPKMPAFPKLAKKPGCIRGYVKDVQGKPVADAYILVTAPTAWGRNKNVSARTNTSGYYEMAVPFPVAQVWYAGYAASVHGVRMALPLHPVDGRVESFSKAGEVENFALLPYGVADPAGVAQQANLSDNYYGGAFTVGYWGGDGPTHLPVGATLEITLTPDSPLLGNVPPRTFVIRQTIKEFGGLRINNVPLGRYKITARLVQNGNTVPLRLSENGNADRAGATRNERHGDTAVPHGRRGRKNRSRAARQPWPGRAEHCPGPMKGVFLMDKVFPHPAVMLRAGRPEDAEACGTICYEAFKAIAERHGFPPDIPSVEVASGLLSLALSHPDIYSVVAEADDGRVVGSNFLWEGDTIAGVGPITVDPAVQNGAIGRRLMEDVLERAREKRFAGVRLVQAAYHSRSLSLYAKLGFEVREPLANLQGPALGLEVPGYAVRPAAERDLDACSRLCRRVHGHDRGQELREAIRKGAATLVEHDGRITGYATGIGFFDHAVGEGNQDLKALIGAASAFSGPGFLLPIRNGELFRWCLEQGLRVNQTMTLMSLGLYNEPAGAFLPSVLY
jgi:predicted N-acetyltransferase YhbS